MRPLLALVLSVLILGGLALFMYARDDAPRTGGEVVQRVAKGTYAVDLTPSFSAEPDPFALKTDTAEQPAALVLSLNGKELARRNDKVTAGDPIRIEEVPGIIVGQNEFLLIANPPLDQGNREHAIRVRILRDGQPISERTFWSQPGTRLEVAFPLTVEAADTAPTEHDHK